MKTRNRDILEHVSSPTTAQNSSFPSYFPTMSLFIVCIKFYNLYHSFDTNLEELGFSGPIEKWAVKWLIKNVLFTTFILCRFNVDRFFERQRNMDSLLKVSAIGIALTAAWIPCVKAYPLLSVFLMTLETFFITIGPIYAIPIIISNFRYTNLIVNSIERLILDKYAIIIFLGSFPLSLFKHSEACYFVESIMAATFLFCMLFDDVLEDFKRSNRMREVEELRRLQLLAIGN